MSRLRSVCLVAVLFGCAPAPVSAGGLATYGQGALVPRGGCAQQRTFGSIQTLSGTLPYTGSTTVTGGTLLVHEPTGSSWYRITAPGTLCVSGFDGTGAVEAAWWTIPGDTLFEITDPGGMPSVVVDGTMVASSGCLITVLGTPQRMPALLLRGTIIGTCSCGSVPAGMGCRTDAAGVWLEYLP